MILVLIERLLVCKKVWIHLSFIHLQVATGYSLLSSTISIAKLVEQAKQYQFQALAITDHNVMYGAIPFYQECLKHGVKPIIGMTADIISDIQPDKVFPLILLAKNNKGYHNLVKISSILQTKSPKGISLKWLKGYQEGLYGITPGIEGEIEQFLLDNNEEAAMNAACAYRDALEDDAFFFSFQLHGQKAEEMLLPRLKELSASLRIKAVITNDVRYLHKNDAFSYECLLAIRDGVKLSGQESLSEEKQTYYLKTAAEMHEMFATEVDELENTYTVASHCHVTIPMNEQHLPKYPLPKGVSATEKLVQLCEQGLEERVPQASPTYLERLHFELKIIQQMHFQDYFLIVWDFMKFAREKRMLTGPGRGSAAGSLVAFVLRITDIDPIEHQLLFERFLNPERISMPDIDIDFPDHRRDEVIAYVTKKYGAMHVAQIITFGTLAAKAVIRDVARAFSFSTKEIDQLSKLIPARLGMTLQTAYEESSRFREFVESSAVHRKLFETAKRLEGLPRHTSTHAAGVVISEQPLVELIPIQEGHVSSYLTQYPMEVLEALGLLKMDFLGLRNLTILEQILESLRRTGKQIDMKNIPIDDDKVFSLLRKGETTGIFQLESDGMRKVLRSLQPTEFEDIVAVNALYRPGPMDNISLYIDRKHGRKPIQYPHPALKEILDVTYGVIVYQEQIMQIAATIAGFSLGQADLLRRAVSKKKKAVLDKERGRFVKGSVANGFDEKTAHALYDLIVRFADYGFNRSHAVAYSFIAYQLAYLKVHYPLYFMASLLTSAIGHEKRTIQYIGLARQMGIHILPPCINRSSYPFVVENNSIRYSLAGVKGVGAVVLKDILSERRKKPFHDLFDFCIRVPAKSRSRKTLESLVYSGAFDLFDKDRAVLLASLDIALEHAALIRPNEQDDLFSEGDFFDLKPKYVEVEPMTMIEVLANEQRVLGAYLTDHPVTPFASLFHDAGITKILHLKEFQRNVSLGVYIHETKRIRTKKGEVMCFMKISDATGELDSVLFPTVYHRCLPYCQEGSVVLVKGKTENRNGKLQLIVDTMETLEMLEEKLAKKQTLFLKITKDQSSYQVLGKVQQVIQRYKGDIPVILYYEDKQQTLQLSQEYGVHPIKKCLTELSELLGVDNVILK